MGLTERFKRDKKLGTEVTHRLRGFLKKRLTYSRGLPLRGLGDGLNEDLPVTNMNGLKSGMPEAESNDIKGKTRVTCELKDHLRIVLPHLGRHSRNQRQFFELFRMQPGLRRPRL